MAMFLSSLVVAVAVGSGLASDAVSLVRPPRAVKVLPILFVPKGAVPPTAAQARDFMKHLEWARKRYAEMLPGHVTFAIAAREPLVFNGREKLDFYRGRPAGGAPDFVDELLSYLKFTQRNCPYILLMLIMNPVDDFPYGGGQPLNGGFNTGGGLVMLPSSGLDKYPIMQSTLQHELGHSFGLPHVDVYGYDMGTNASIMSYNPAHHTDGFAASKTPGTLIPEDLRGLALNQRVFPGLTFEPMRDVPKGYTIAPRIVGLGPAEIQGQLPLVKITTDSGESDGSHAAGILTGPVTPIPVGGKPVFDPESMWRSDKASTGRPALQVELPVEVPLTRIVVHTMPQGSAGAAQEVRVSVQEPGGGFHMVAHKSLRSGDDAISIRRTTGRVWRFEFRTEPGKFVVIRGIQFFSGRDELFPPLVPF